MATYTSVQNGNWNNSATWGGSGYPSAATDIAIIGHTVTYNVVSTTVLGAITINSGGILTFSTGMSTKLTLGHQEITINSGGELRIGASGAVIPQAYTAELIWSPTSDNSKGITIASGGKLTIYGDPAYYGSVDESRLYQDWSAPASGNSTLYVTGNVSGKWLVGQQLLIHKGQAYSNNTNDFCLVSIQATVTYDGAKSTVPVTMVSIPGGAATFYTTGDVLHVSRNVQLYKSGASTVIGNQNTSRPRLINATPLGSYNISINDALFTGWYNVINGFHCNFNGVIRNGYFGANGVTLATINGIFYSNNQAMTGIILINSAARVACHSVTGVNAGLGIVFSGRAFGNVSCMYPGGPGTLISGYVYANSYGIRGGGQADFIITGGVGYDNAGNAKANTYDFEYGTGTGQYIRLKNAKTPASPVFTGINTLNAPGRIKFEHYQQVINAHYIADAFGDVTKISADGSGTHPTQRAGGSADVCEVLAQSNCASASYLDILPPINGPQPLCLGGLANVSKTYRFYLQTDFTALAKSALVLYADYLDQGSGGHLATVSSSTSGHFTTRANQSDWSQYMEVTINPAQTGYINLYIRLMGYESGKKVWVDPLPSVAGKVYQVHWSYGEVVLAEIGGGIIAADAGLLPLGVMEAII
jgi:hypothetical protein